MVFLCALRDALDGKSCLQCAQYQWYGVHLNMRWSSNCSSVSNGYTEDSLLDAMLNTRVKSIPDHKCRTRNDCSCSDPSSCCSVRPNPCRGGSRIIDNTVDGPGFSSSVAQGRALRESRCHSVHRNIERKEYRRQLRPCRYTRVV